jgi:hypothetical protein
MSAGKYYAEVVVGSLTSQPPIKLVRPATDDPFERTAALTVK